jgi:hypothetical protein
MLVAPCGQRQKSIQGDGNRTRRLLTRRRFAGLLRQKQRLLRAAKKQINAALYEVYKTMKLLEEVRRM